jgi:hypothetical protein
MLDCYSYCAVTSITAAPKHSTLPRFLNKGYNSWDERGSFQFISTP